MLRSHLGRLFDRPSRRLSPIATVRDRGPRKVGTVGLLVVAWFLTPLLAVPAGAQRPHVPIPYSPVPLDERYCGFPVVITFPQVNQYIIRQTTSPDGTTTLQIAGHLQATVTNQDTGESVTYNISGPGSLVIFPDGAFSIDAAGPNLLWTLPENLVNFPAVPTISYTTGHVTVAVDASGQTTSYTLAGGARQTDVCAVLAS